MHMSFTGERYVPEMRGQISYEHFHRYALALEFARDKDVLDIASGEGYGTAALALVARSALGVDSDEATVRHAGARYTGMNLDFRAGDATQIPAADGAFDLVVSFETIEHLAEHERMLGEIRRVLRPDGRLIISSPNKLIYSEARDYENPFHVRELYFHEFRDLLRTFFPAVHLFGQRVFAGSAIHPLRGSGAGTRWLGSSATSEAGITALPDPEYFIAVCGRSDDDELPDLCSVYLDARDELLDDLRNGGLAGTAMPFLAGGDRQALPGGMDTTPAPLLRGAGGRIAELEAELVRRTEVYEAELARRTDELRLTQRRFAELQLQQQNTDEAARRIAEAELMLQGIVHSRSWQVTRPMRRAMALLRSRRSSG